VTEAVTRASKGLGKAKPSYGFLFASPDRDLGAARGWAREAGLGVELIGCTTAVEITELGLTHGGLSIMLVASDNSDAKLAFAEQLKGDPRYAANELLSGMDEFRRAAAQRDQRHLTTVLLCDGLSGAGEKLVSDLYDRGLSNFQIVGGAAGDEGKFKATYAGAGTRAAGDAAAALHVCSAKPWGVGVNHGLRPTTKQMRVTKATDNVVWELDGEPAFSAYKRHAASRGVKLTQANAGPYLIGNELGIHFFESVAKARAPLSVGAEGSLVCAAEIPKGSMVSILDGDPPAMIEAAKSAAEEAKKHLLGAEAAGVLLFDCVCRGMILKDYFQREIDAVRSVFGDVPIAGFLTYGEIARYQGKLDGWHNATAVVVAIPK